jgi:uncharacterized protein
MKNSNFSPGSTIVYREFWDGKIWLAIPMLVIRDEADLVALHIPLGTVWKRHESPDGRVSVPRLRQSRSWVLRDAVWESHGPDIRLAIPGEPYSIFLFRNEGNNTLRYWYVNLEEDEAPMHRTAKGFDSTDLLLDLIIEPNLRDWRWDDEDELQEAVEIGLVTREKARALYVKGEEVRNLIMSGSSVYNEWKNWRPDPSWKVPVLPDGWDRE